MILKKDIFDAIVAQARRELPNECCGYFAGDGITISRHFELTNIDKSPEHFAFDPKEQFETVRAVREAGLKIMANYHSHPETPARPSEEDIRLAYDPDILYFILSLKGNSPMLKAFEIKDGNVREIELEFVD